MRLNNRVFDGVNSRSIHLFMNKKSLILIAIAIVLGAVYIIHFTTWFKPKVILISHNERFGTINFSLSGVYQLTDVRVVPVSALASNKYALPIWELKSDSNSGSRPIRVFSYGEHIHGMKSVVDASFEPLVSGQTYRLFVEAGSRKIEHDFTPSSNAPEANRRRPIR